MKSLKEIFKTRKTKQRKLTSDEIREKFRELMRDVEQLEHQEMCLLLVKLRVQLTDAIRLELEKWELSEMHSILAKNQKHSNNQN